MFCMFFEIKKSLSSDEEFGTFMTRWQAEILLCSLQARTTSPAATVEGQKQS